MSGTMSGREEFSFLDDSNKELPRSRMKDVRYVNFETVALIFLSSHSTITRKQN